MTSTPEQRKAHALALVARDTAQHLHDRNIADAWRAARRWSASTIDYNRRCNAADVERHLRTALIWADRHEYLPENITRNGTGSRWCKVCRNAADRRRYAAKKSA